MLSKKMEKALNQQINEELFSAYLYYAMSGQMDALNLPGMASWLISQTQEELFHAHKFFTHVNERGGRVEMKAIKQPQNEWESPLAAFEAAYEHECHISDCINKLMKLAREENDYATENMLQWVVEEQVEEEASVDDIVQKLKLVGDGGGMFMLDKEMSTRVFTPPPTESSE